MPKLSIPLDSSHLAILGIQCPLFKGHNIVHFINKNLQLELKRDDDFIFYPPDGKEVQCLYFFQDVEREQVSYYVISNKNPQLLFAKLPQVDFLLVVLFPLGISLKYIENKMEEVIREIGHIEQVFAIRPIALKKQEHSDYFIQDFLTHTVQVNEKYKPLRPIRPRRGGFDSLRK